MPANSLPFEFNYEGKGENTRVDYAFKDGDHAVRESIVLEGRLSEAEVREISGNLLDGCSFLPRKLGLPDLLSKMPAIWVETDEPYHFIERISYTPRAESDFAPSAEQFAALAGNYDFAASWNPEAPAA